MHTLLGGAIRTRIPITHSLGLIPIEDAEREATKVTDEGIRTIKIKVGVDADRDVEMVAALRDAVGPGVEICIDANQGYATPGDAIQTYPRMEALNSNISSSRSRASTVLPRSRARSTRR